MADLYVKNPNYNPLDPKSNRYVTDTEAQNQAGTKATSLNDMFAPFGALFKPFNPSNFYTPLPQNATVVPTSKTGTPISTAPNMSMAPTAPMSVPPANNTNTPAAPAAPNAPAAPAGGGATYTIQAGDTLGAIAARNGTTIQALVQANGIVDPNKIRAGQVLNLGLGGVPNSNINAGGGAPNMGGAPAAGNGAGGAAPVTVPQGALTTQEIANLAKKAGEAGMSASEFMSLLQTNSNVSSTQMEEIRTKLGIPNLVDETFRQPDKSTIDTYKELYDLAGLRDIQTKISAIDESINKKRADLVKATGDINNNPWISQGTRAGRLKNLQELAYADINNDIERKNQYLDIYDKGVSEVEKQVGFISADRADARALNVDKLNYLLNEAERIQSGVQNDTITAGLRNVPDFLQGALNRESTAQARDLEKIRAQKTGSGGSTNALLQLLASAGDSASADAIIKSSAGGKATTDTFRQSYEKTLNTLYQLSDLNDAFKAYKDTGAGKGLFNTAEGELTGPIMGILRSANPYDTKAQQIKAQLQAIVPNLARGVYGEVGVLTDQDIQNYSQTLPNLKSTKEVRDALLAITAKSVYRSLENKLLVQAKGGVDVSAFSSDLVNMKKQVDTMLQSAGVPIESPVTGGTDYSSADAEYVKSLNL